MRLSAKLLAPILLAYLIAIGLRRIDFDVDTNGDWSEAPPWPIFKAVLWLERFFPAAETTLMPPHIRLAGIASALIQSKALYVAAKLGVADALAAGPMEIAELAAATGVKASHLRRVLRLLVTVGVFKEPRPGMIANNRASGLLRRDHPTSVLDLVLLYGDESYFSFGKLYESMDLDHPGIPFVDASGGLTYWDWTALPENLAIGERFDRAMVAISAWNIPPLLQDYDWSVHRNHTLVDVGGGLGGILAAVLEQQPTMRGILFERPEETERARELWGRDRAALLPRVQFVAGDFFKALPEADVFFAQHILHDHEDEPCIQILRAIRAAMGPAAAAGTGVLLLSDIVMPARAADVGPAKAGLDLQMLAIPGGKERTTQEWSVLLEAGGFSLERVVPLRSLDSLIVARPIKGGEAA